MEVHVKHLGSLFIALGAFLGILFAALFVAILLYREPSAADASFGISAWTGQNAALLSGGVCLCTLPGIITGWGLLKLRAWARTLGIVLSALCLVGFPFGTALGIYGLWVLRNKDSLALFGLG